MRPDPLIVRAYLARGARLWVLTRALLIVAFLLAGGDPFRLSAVEFVTIIILSAAVAFLETRQRRESALLGNLGVSPLVLGVLFAGPALVGEIVLRLGVAAVA